MYHFCRMLAHWLAPGYKKMRVQQMQIQIEQQTALRAESSVSRVVVGVPLVVISSIIVLRGTG